MGLLCGAKGGYGIWVGGRGVGLMARCVGRWASCSRWGACMLCRGVAGGCADLVLPGRYVQVHYVHSDILTLS